MISKIKKMEHTDEDLRKVIEEVLMNSKIPEWDREIKIYMGPKQWEMFDNTIKAWIKNESK